MKKTVFLLSFLLALLSMLIQCDLLFAAHDKNTHTESTHHSITLNESKDSIAYSHSPDKHTVQLKDNTESIPLSHPIPTLIWQVDDAQNIQETFRSNQYNLENFPISLKPGEHIAWQRLSLFADFDESIEKTFVLHIDNAMIDHLTIYLTSAEYKILQVQNFGLDDSGYSPQLTRGQKNFAFNVKGGQHRYIFIKKQSVSPPVLLMSLKRSDVSVAATQNQFLFWGGIIALLLGIGIYNIIIYLISANPAFFWYLSFYLVSFFYFSGLHGFGSLLWSDDFQKIIANNLMLLNFTLLWLVLRFSLSFLNAQQNAPIFFKWLKRIEPLIILGWFANFLFAEFKLIPVFATLQTIVSIGVIVTAIKSYKSGFYPARFFILSWTFVVAGGGIGMATFTGNLPVSFFTTHAFFFGAITELLLLSVALADRLRYAEKIAVAKAFIDPRTHQPNFSFFKSDAFQINYPEGDDKQQLFFLLIQVEGVKDVLGLMGPNRMEAAYQTNTQRFEKFLRYSQWAVPFEVGPNEKRYMITLPGNQILIIVSCDNELESIVKSIIALTHSPIRFEEFESKFLLRVGVAPLAQTDRRNRQIPPQQIHEAYRQAQLALLSCEKRKEDWNMFSPDHDEMIRRQLLVLNELRQAIDHSGFTIYVQPQFDIQHRQLIGGEVLIRWLHDQLGFVSPGEFIPLAEKTANIYPITQIVIDKSFAWLSAQNIDKKKYEDFKLSINLSVHDIYRKDLLQYIKQRMLHYKLNPNQIMFEVTESSIIEDHQTFLMQINALSDLGFSIALDDFGTGYSSMSYLQKLQFNEIKIDLSFVRNIDQSPVNQKIVKAIIQLSKSINAFTVAEGIETEEEFQVLKSLGAESVQGYLLGKPVSSQDFSQLYF